MKISRPILHQMRQIGARKDVERQPLARLLDEGQLQLADDLTAGTVAPEEVARLDEVGLSRELVEDFGEDNIRRWAREAHVARVEADGPAGVGGALDQDGFEEGLRQVDVVARAGGFVGALRMIFVSVWRRLSGEAGEELSKQVSNPPYASDHDPTTKPSQTLRPPCYDTTACAPCACYLSRRFCILVPVRCLVGILSGNNQHC